MGKNYTQERTKEKYNQIIEKFGNGVHKRQDILNSCKDISPTALRNLALNYNVSREVKREKGVRGSTTYFHFTEKK